MTRNHYFDSYPVSLVYSRDLVSRANEKSIETNSFVVKEDCYILRLGVF